MSASARAKYEQRGVLFRHTIVWLKSKQYGSVKLGRTNTASEGITEICLGCAITPNSAEEGGQVSSIVGASDTGYRR